MSKFSFLVPILCEGEIEDEHDHHDKLQSFLNHLIDRKLEELEHTGDKLKLNIWRDKPVTIYRKLDFD